MEISALKTKRAEEVSKWIYDNIIHRYGVPDIHITDNGSKFANHLSKEMLKIIGSQFKTDNALPSAG